MPWISGSASSSDKGATNSIVSVRRLDGTAAAVLGADCAGVAEGAAVGATGVAVRGIKVAVGRGGVAVGVGAGAHAPMLNISNIRARIIEVYFIDFPFRTSRFVTLSEAKGLITINEMLRSAQHDNVDCELNVRLLEMDL